ncbi:sensor histidine kinase [Streptosporangium sp. NPDC000396]|uniref:sensor histidine kinase n=1 Tax=Streptosporangium sp. NPDC000396 TaxID=3366185 RepID=UPI00368F1199
MLINAEKKGARRFGRFALSLLPRTLPRFVIPRRRKRSPVERFRRWTVHSLTGGIFLAWAGGFAGVMIEVGEKKEAISVPGLIIGLAGLSAFTVLYMRMIRAAVDGTTATREIVASGAVVLALLLTQGSYLWAWGLLAPAWASAVVPLLNRFGSLVVTVGATAVPMLLTSWDTAVPAFVARPYAGEEAGTAVGAYLGMALVIPWANRLQLWFWKVARTAEEGKAAQARLAVTEERLRFSRDLHDLVGHSLSAIAVKSEVAVKLAKTDAERAAAEMAEVRGLAREALKEIRAAVRGYRTVDLDAELRSMVAVLEAGGIRCTLESPHDEIPEEQGTLLAWVVREGTTNVLRHSSATRCRIAIALRDGEAVLEMVNNGVDGMSGRGGTGLLGLSERVAAVGGVVTAGAGGAGEFRLRATIPLEGVR